MKIMMDENVHSGLRSFLTSLKLDVKLVPKGVKNGTLFTMCQSEKRVLLTRDADFLEEHFRIANQHGILLLRIPPKDLESQKLCLNKLLKNSKLFKGKVFKLLTKDHFEEVK